MTYDERDEIMGRSFERVKELLTHKGKDYGTKEDANSNFKECEGAGITRFQAWFVLANKHWSSIKNAIANSPEHPRTVTEPLESRIYDSIAYNIILLGMIRERELENIL